MINTLKHQTTKNMVSFHCILMPISILYYLKIIYDSFNLNIFSVYDPISDTKFNFCQIVFPQTSSECFFVSVGWHMMHANWIFYKCKYKNLKMIWLLSYNISQHIQITHQIWLVWKCRSASIIRMLFLPRQLPKHDFHMNANSQNYCFLFSIL